MEDLFGMLGQQSDRSTEKPALPNDSAIIVAVTWNLQGGLPPLDSLRKLSTSASFHPSPDLIFIGTQQCEHPLWLTLCCEGKSAWEDMLNQTFASYTLCSSKAMRGMHSAVLVKSPLKQYFAEHEWRTVKAGAGGCMGNKGAIGVIATFMGQKYLLLNCHLAPHQTNSPMRNRTINRILEELIAPPPSCQTIFLGDFNYRIDITRSEYNELIPKQSRNTQTVVDYYRFLEKEQLNGQRQLQKNFLLYYSEGEISFPPTYKLGSSDDEYSHSRIPGWTDRIFVRKNGRLQLTSYKCEYSIFGSDHRPVIAAYSCPVTVASLLIFPPADNNSCQLI